MRTNTLVSLALSASNVVNAVKFLSGPEGWGPSIGYNATPQTWPDIEESRFVSRVVAPKRQELKQRIPQIPNSKSVKLRYGPYTVPAPMIPGGEGMVWNSPSPSVDKPCSKCIILGMNAGLEYAEGGDANTDTMMWLHHMVLFNIGSGAWDATCTVFGLPHMIVGSLPATSERIFSSGNERTIVFFNPPGSKINNMGYPVFPSDRFGLIADLMNMNPSSKQVYMTMYFDYIDGHPTGFEEVKPVWFDVAQCGTSEVGGGSAGSNFKIASSAWTANFEGDVLGIGGHIHDGGTKLDVVVNGEVICTSSASYGSDEEAKARADIIKAGGVPDNNPGHMSMSGAAMGGGHGHAGGKHIIAMSVCGDYMGGFNGSPSSPLKLSKVKKGQSWLINAYYDYKQHDGMKSNFGGMDNVMGISIMFVKTNPRIRSKA